MAETVAGRLEITGIYLQLNGVPAAVQGGAGVELPAQKIRSAVAEFESYKGEAAERFADLEAELVEIRARVDRLETKERGGLLP
jgi:uncharacterized protein YceH (UPF0502 family)